MELKHALLYKHIGAKIAYFRKLNGISQQEFAKRINLSESALSKIENGRYNENLSLELLQTIADGLNVKMTTLITLDNKEKKFWKRLYKENGE
jgi:transcriptional regulator with XRE-family HTH domain